MFANNVNAPILVWKIVYCFGKQRQIEYREGGKFSWSQKKKRNKGGRMMTNR